MGSINMNSEHILNDNFFSPLNQIPEKIRLQRFVKNVPAVKRLPKTKLSLSNTNVFVYVHCTNVSNVFVTGLHS